MLTIGKSRLRFIKRPIRPSILVDLTKVILASDMFEVEGEVEIHADRGESAQGWRVGFAQIIVKDVDRASYKGVKAGEGSVSVARDRSPSRLHDLCRDGSRGEDAFDYPPDYVSKGDYSPQNPLNVSLTNVALPTKVKVSHVDAPANFFPMLWPNKQTNAINTLRSIQINYRFCVIFMVGRPDGSFQQLQHFYWKMDWDVGFEVAPTGGFMGLPKLTSRRPTALDMTFGPFMAGPVPDSRFAALLAAPVLPTCNQVLRLESIDPEVTESSR